jgi:hypothetical protein
MARRVLPCFAVLAVATLAVLFVGWRSP